MRVSSTLPALALVAAGPACLTAAADGPGVGTPTVVSLGDSAISGEAGRWAGNTNKSPSRTDALGPTAYFDNAGNTGEQIPGCHRSKAAEVHLGGGREQEPGMLGRPHNHLGVRPGEQLQAGHRLLRRRRRAHRPGQGAAAARRHAQRQGGHVTDRREQLPLRRHRPDLRDRLAHVTVVVEELLPRRLNIAPLFTPSNIATQTANIKTAILNVRTAMSSAGYADSSYSILVSTYWNPIPRGSGFRYPETGYTGRRSAAAGCGTPTPTGPTTPWSRRSTAR